MIKYKTVSYGKNKIEPVEVARETESSVWIEHTICSTRGDRKEERRSAKSTSYESFHDTWEAAKQHLLDKAEAKLWGARRSLELAQAEFGNIKGMKQE